MPFRWYTNSGGVLLGEHIGQTFTILWMFLISLALLRSHLSRPWLSWLGIVASFVYLLAQTELFATIIPDFPIVPEAGLLGSLLWLGWMICLGVTLWRAKNAESEPITLNTAITR